MQLRFLPLGTHYHGESLRLWDWLASDNCERLLGLSRGLRVVWLLSHRLEHFEVVTRDRRVYSAGLGMGTVV